MIGFSGDKVILVYNRKIPYWRWKMELIQKKMDVLKKDNNIEDRVEKCPDSGNGVQLYFSLSVVKTPYSASKSCGAACGGGGGGGGCGGCSCGR